jgi:predicted acyl esterase
MRNRYVRYLLCGLGLFWFANGLKAQVNVNGKIDAISEFSTRYTVPFTMPDGIKLSTDVFLPITQDCMLVEITLPLPAFLGGTTTVGNVMMIPNRTQLIIYDSIGGQPNPNPYQLPVVFTRTPYDKSGDPTGEYVNLFGYASIMQDMRGRYASEGVYMPMYSDSWDKNPYHPNYGHVLDVTDLSDPRNGNRHEDGYNSIRFIVDSLMRDYGSLPHTNTKMTTGDIAMFGASALGNSQYQAAAAHRIDPDPTKPGLKALFPIVATLEHYRYTGYQNGVFRDRIVTGWLKGQIFTGTDDDLNPIDNDIDNTLHSATDYGLPNKFDAANKAIDHFCTVRYNNENCGYYPNSRGRADMDATAAPVDANGEGDANGQFSRYTNLKVPAYHLSGWWDIFTDGQIETWQRMRQYNPQIANMQKLVIGPWAHQTTGGQTTGDLTYPNNVSDLIGIDLDDFGNNLDLGKAVKSEIIGWFRYNLNHIPGRELGEPKVILPESQVWQDVGSPYFQVRIPSEDVVVPLEVLINFVIGEGDFSSVPVEVRETIFNTVLPFTIPVPNLGSLIDNISASPMGPIPFTDFSQGIPDVRFYVPGPVDDGVAANAGVGNYWFGTDTFPMVQHIRWTPKYLHANGSINDAAPSADEGYKLYVHDPDNPLLTIGGSNMIVRTPDGTRDSQGQFNLADPRYAPYTMDRDGVIAFETPLLTDTMSIRGFPVMTLYAKSNPAGATTGPTDTDFNVRVLDVYPDGREFFVFEGIVNARGRDYAKHLADHGVENKDIPFSNIDIGKIYQYKFRMLPIAYTWGIDHKMKILIGSSNYTRYQVNPNLPIEDGEFFRRKPGDGQTYMYNGVEMAPRVAVQRVHFSPDHPCFINLPVYDPTFFVGETEPQGPVENTDMLVYPNPTAQEANVYASKPGNYQVQVLNALGQVVYENTMHDHVTFSVAKFQAGVYFVRMTDLKTAKLATERLVVTH